MVCRGQGLHDLRRPAQIAQLRGRDVHEVAPKPMLAAVAAAEAESQAKRAAALEEVYSDEPSRPRPSGGRR